MHRTIPTLCFVFLASGISGAAAESHENVEKTTAVLREISSLTKSHDSGSKVGKLLGFRDTALPVAADLMPHFFGSGSKEIHVIEEIRKKCKPSHSDKNCVISQIWFTLHQLVAAVQISRGRPEMYSYGLWSPEAKDFVYMPRMPNDTPHTSEMLLRITDIDGDGNIELITFRGSDEGAPESFFMHEWDGKKLLPFIHNGK